MGSSRERSKGRSCDACHQRKIHCDSTSVLKQCDWCKHQGILCTYNRPFGRKKRKRPPSPSGSLQQTKKTPVQATNHDTPVPLYLYRSSSPESALPPRNLSSAEAQWAGAASSTRPGIKTIPYVGLGGFYFNGVHLGGISSSQGIPFFSSQGTEWIFTHTNSTPRSLAPSNIHPPNAVHGTWELPEKAVVLTYVTVFLTTAKCLVFPMIDEATFMDTINTAYDEGNDPTLPEVICAKACVLSFVCVMIHMNGEPDNLPCRFQAEECAKRANAMMPTIIANPSTESIQVCAMLCMYNIFSGNVSTAATYLSIAYRFLSMFGAHINPPGMTSIDCSLGTASANAHYLRRVFWHCYMYDKDICLRAGYPPVIDDDHCDLTLPPGYKSIDQFNHSRDGSDLIPGDMRLTIIKSKMIRLLYCAKAFHGSDVDLLKDIRELDNELEAWRVSIPLPYQPQLSSLYRLHVGPDWNKAKQVHVIVIHFEYYFLLALIHSASGRCRIEPGYKDNISSCQALALQASRSILANLAVVARVFNSGDFWFFLLYPMSASLTIFCNILTSPLNSQAAEDLELLRKAPKLIKDMYSVSLAPPDSLRLRQVQQFVEELVRLGRAAIDKASEHIV